MFFFSKYVHIYYISTEKKIKTYIHVYIKKQNKKRKANVDDTQETQT